MTGLKAAGRGIACVPTVGGGGMRVTPSIIVRRRREPVFWTTCAPARHAQHDKHSPDLAWLFPA